MVVASESAEPLRELQLDYGECLVEPFPYAGGCTRIIDVQPPGQVLQQAPGRLDVGVRIGAREGRLHPRTLGLGQILEHVAPFMHLASLYQGCGAEGLHHRSVERLRSIEDDEQTAVGP